MSNLPANLTAFISQPDLLSELLPVAVDLFRKDLESSGIDFQQGHVNDVYSFREIALNVIRTNGGIASEKIMRLLYRVDIHQSKTETSLQETDPESSLAEQMVIRELQKAYTRKLFR